VFWGYLAVSLLIAIFAVAVRYRGRWVVALYQQLLSHQIWFHPSSLLDVKLIFVKAVVRVLFFATWLVSSYGIALGLVKFGIDQFGAADVTFLADSTITIMYTMVLFLSADFSRYFVHRLCHEIPILWQFHQVHHSAEVMTPLTLYRSHPVENLISTLRGIVVTGFVTGVFFYHFGTKAVQAEILGVNALGLLYNMLGANLRHSHVWISYGPVIERFLLSPAQHQLHHSDAPHHHGANYGSCLAIWDKIGGSLQIAFGQKNLAFGLPDESLNHDPRGLKSALLGPFRGCWRLVSERFTDRLKCEYHRFRR